MTITYRGLHVPVCEMKEVAAFLKHLDAPNRMRTTDTDWMTEQEFLAVATRDLGVSPRLAKQPLLSCIAERLAVQVEAQGFYNSAVDHALNALTQMGFDVEPFGILPLERRWG